MLSIHGIYTGKEIRPLALKAAEEPGENITAGQMRKQLRVFQQILS